MMDMMRQIQVAVVQVDMFICSAIHCLKIILPSAAVLLLTLAAVRLIGGGR